MSANMKANLTAWVQVLGFVIALGLVGGWVGPY